MKKQVFTTAWSLFKTLTDKFSTFSAALKAAWKICKLKAALNIGVTEFSFVKKDGSLRKAFGKSLSSVNYTPKTNRPASPSLLKFWDVEKNAVRSCQVWQLV